MGKARAGISVIAALTIMLSLVACARHAASDPDADYGRGLRLRQQGDLDPALEVANRGLARFGKQPDSQWYWSFRLLKAEVLLGKDDTAQAATLLPDPSMALPQAPYLQVRLLTDHGWLRLLLADYNGSLEFLNRALDLARSRNLPQLIAEIEIRRASDLVRLGRYRDAEPDAEDALRLAKQVGDLNLQSSAVGTMGFIRMNTNRFDEAVPWFQQALNLFDQVHSKSGTARTETNIGWCYMMLGQPDKAFEIFRRAEALAAKISDTSDQQVSLGRLGDLYQGTGDYRQAFSYYNQALAIATRSNDPHWMASWLHNLTEVSIQLGDPTRAVDYNRQALALQTKMDEPAERLWPEIDRARIAVALKRPREAEGIYRSVMQSAQSLDPQHEPSLVLAAHAELANLLVSAHRNSEAEVEFQQALVLIDTERASLERDDYRITYFSSLVGFYQGYVDLLASEHRQADALRVAESSRARVLSEKLGVVDSANATGGSKAHSNDYRKLARASRTVLLSYWLAPRRSYLWVITPAKVTQFELPRQQQIESLARDYNRTIGQLRDPLGEGSDTGRKLYEVLLAPAQGLIPAGSSVAIAPDGELHNLNFGALPVGDASRYWIEDVRVSVIPSLDLALRRSRAPQKRGAKLLLIGDPLPPDTAGFPKLAQAGPEMEGIRREFSGSTLLTGAVATPGAYAASRPGQFSMIHFTAHAEANPDDPLDSAIILSPEGERYKLYARDVMSLPIHADLVTVSACRGAASQTYAGEGLVGFAWSFLRAGARNVIAGLWEVDDNSTAELMETLYGGLRDGMTPQQALRQAQLTLLHSEGPHHKPYYWAPFQVFSDALAN